MRAIKFRVWQNEYGKTSGHFLTVDEENPYLFYNGGVPYNLTEIFNYHLVPEREKWERFSVQQFTGLTDKTGKEIFEGDILDVNPVWRVGANDYREVYFNSGSWMMKGVDGIAFLNEGFVLNWKIIGNIFENPELILDTKSKNP